MFRKYPSLFLLFFVIGGIVVADRLRLPSWPFLLAAPICLLAALYLQRRKAGAVVGVLFGLTIGLMSACHFSLNYVDIGPYHLGRLFPLKQAVRIWGRVADWPDLKKDRTEIRIALDSLGGDLPRRVDGAILLKISDTTTVLQRGDRVAFLGRIYPLPTGAATGDFDYGRFLNLKGVHGIVYLPTVLGVQVQRRSELGYLGLVDWLRAATSGSLKRNLDDVSAALASGFLIGETRNIPTDVYSMFRDSGTLHLLAVSGSNVALVLFFLALLMRPFNLKPLVRSVVLLVVIAVFAGMSYGEPSVMRAGIMAALVIASRLLRRPPDLNNIIALTALIILLMAPAQLYDVGFQLSFVTAWGLIFFVPKVGRLFVRYHNTRWYRWLVLPLLVSLIAQICSTPVIAYYFGRIPLISVLANLVIVPMVSVGVIGILALLAADLIWPIFGLMVGSIVNIWLKWVVVVLTWFGGDNIPVVDVSALSTTKGSAAVVILIYTLLVLVGWSFSSRRARRWLVFAVLLIVNAGLITAAVGGSNRETARVEIESVPGGVGAMVYWPGTVAPDLILTGLDARRYELDEKILLPMLQRQGEACINRLFLLSADYNALDDVLRFAQTTRAVALYVNAELRSSMEDQRRSYGYPADTSAMNYWGSRDDSCVAPGYYPSGGCLSLRFDRSLIRFVNRRSDLSADPGPGASATLVIGTPWRGRPDDWIELHRGGYDKIVCSKIAQSPGSAYSEPAREADNVPPDYLYDLSQSGPYTCLLPFSL